MSLFGNNNTILHRSEGTRIENLENEVRQLRTKMDNYAQIISSMIGILGGQGLTKIRVLEEQIATCEGNFKDVMAMLAVAKEDGSKETELKIDDSTPTILVNENR